ncbi:MAG: tetratricopeptide repeat protein [Pseudomonadota bacterium]
MKLLLVLPFIIGLPALAACPAAPEITSDLDRLIDQANAAETETAGRELSGQMWELWLKAPDAAAQDVLDRGMRASANRDFKSARDAFDQLIAYCPEYAEGFNQRAFVYFRQQEFEPALVDLEKALALSPKHVGAQSGRALTLMHLGRLGEARLQLQQALKNNPWLSERALLTRGGPLAVQGEEI